MNTIIPTYIRWERFCNL